MTILYERSATIQPINEANLTGMRDVPLSPAFSRAEEYIVSEPRAETADGMFVMVRVIKFPTFVRLVVDEGFTAAFVECEVTPRTGG